MELQEKHCPTCRTKVRIFNGVDGFKYIPKSDSVMKHQLTNAHEKQIKELQDRIKELEEQNKALLRKMAVVKGFRKVAQDGFDKIKGLTRGSRERVFSVAPVIDA